MTRTTRLFLSSALTASAVLAQSATDHPSGPRITPPVVNVVAPRGISRGTTAELTVEGLNLAQTKAILFSEPGVKGRIVRIKELPDLPDIRLGSNGTPSTIDLGPLPPRNQVTIEVDVSADAPVGPVSFRLQNVLGTSPTGTFLVEPYYGESPDAEPGNDEVAGAFETFLPTILVGNIARPGDVDHFKVKAKAGQQVVFLNQSTLIGSALSPLVAIVAEDGKVLAEYGGDGGASTRSFAHRFEAAGTYYVRVGDALRGGSGNHIYRILAGQFPVTLSTYPLGVLKGQSRTVALRGHGLKQQQITVKGDPMAGSEDRLLTRPASSFAEVALAVGTDPEVEAAGTNTAVAAAQPVALNTTVNGRVPEGKAHYYRVSARKGQKVAVEVLARRLGSELDSVVDVLDAQGKPIEQVVARPIIETFTTLRDHDSAQRGIRLANTNSLAAGDYLLVGGEVMRIEEMPKSPDDDTKFESFMGQRVAYFNTTPEAHANERSVYKVQMLAPGANPTPNGLPLARLTYRNDDGGAAYGKDSLLQFTAPADGDYLVRVADVRGMGGEEYAYRLNVRQPRPDFRLSATVRNPNVPLGGTVPLNVTALRIDGFDGPIEVTLSGLPAGVRATATTIAPGQVTGTLLLSADRAATIEQAIPVRYVGRAKVGEKALERVADPEDKLVLLSLMPAADVTVTTTTKVIELEPGKSAELPVAIARHNGFGGRVPLSLRNLPPRVHVPDIGLNGVLINEDETARSVTIEALPSAEPIEQLIYVTANTETRSSLPTASAAPEPVLLRIKAKAMTAAR